MTFNSTHAAADHINRYHIRFAEHGTTPMGNPHAFTVLMKARDFINSSAATGFTFPAVMNDGTKTEIEMTLTGDDSWTYIERPETETAP